jgi:hypothetical protein
MWLEHLHKSAHPCVSPVLGPAVDDIAEVSPYWVALSRMEHVGVCALTAGVLHPLLHCPAGRWEWWKRAARHGVRNMGHTLHASLAVVLIGGGLMFEYSHSAMWAARNKGVSALTLGWVAWVAWVL